MLSAVYKILDQNSKPQ